MLAKELIGNHFRSKDISFFRRKVKTTRISLPTFYPWRKNRSKFHGLIVEILLQRTRAEQVIGVYKKLCSKYRESKSLTRAPLKDIKKIIAPLGLSWRARKIKEMSAIINQNYAGEIPENYDELVLLPGVGDYAASAFLSLHCKKRAVLIDSNTIRLLSRFFGFKTNPETRRNPLIKKLMEKITPYARIRKFNYTLLDLSRQICSFATQCDRCPLRKKCFYFNHERNRDDKT